MNAWLRGLRVYRDPRMVLLLFLGFSSGLPLLLVFGTLTFWLVDVGLSRTTIGLFAAASTPYTLKFLWAPFIDRVPIPGLQRVLGHRRAWMLLTQLALATALLSLAASNPAIDPLDTAFWAVVVAALSASQDVVIDAYRVELLEPDEQGAGAAAAVFGYRLGMLVAGAGALYAAAFFEGWHETYALMAAFMGVGIVATLLAREPDVPPRDHTDSVAEAFVDAVVGPFRDFLRRDGALLILVFVVLYKLGEALAGVMTNPLLVDVGFSKLEIANVAKTFGLVASLVGTAAGGALVRALGIPRALWIAGILQLVSNFVFVGLPIVGDEVWALTVAIGVENLSGGLGTAAFVAYLSSLCSVAYTATQYALLTSVSSLARTWLSASGGWFAEVLGWIAYFSLTAVAAIPGLIVLRWLWKRGWTGVPEQASDEAEPAPA